MLQLLDNIFWHALCGPQACFAEGGPTARRFARGFSPMLGFADNADPDLAAIAPHCDPGEQFYCDGWSGAVPPGWRLVREARMHKMVWAGGPAPDADAADARRLGADDAAQALALALLTRPGPFGPRTIELGEYFGIFEGDRLVAMAGERLHAGALREISGICTHPDRQGRGLAGRLTAKVLRSQLARGETPFLHVMCDNHAAHAFYLRIGFRDYRTSVVRIIERA